MLDVKKLRIGDLVLVKVEMWGSHWTMAAKIGNMVDSPYYPPGTKNIALTGFKWSKGLIVQKEKEAINSNNIKNIRMLSPMEYQRLERLFNIQQITKQKAKEIFNSWT